jgi:hypothetical protein
MKSARLRPRRKNRHLRAGHRAEKFKTAIRKGRRFCLNCSIQIPSCMWRHAGQFSAGDAAA